MHTFDFMSTKTRSVDLDSSQVSNFFNMLDKSELFQFRFSNT